VEQYSENPCVGGSIPPLGTILIEFIICSSWVCQHKSSGNHHNSSKYSENIAVMHVWFRHIFFWCL